MRICVFLFAAFVSSFAFAATPADIAKCAQRVAEGHPLSVEYEGKEYDLTFSKPPRSLDRFSSVKVFDHGLNFEVPTSTFPEGAVLMLPGGQYLVINHPNWMSDDDYYYTLGKPVVRFDASDIEFTPEDGKSPIHGHLLSAGATGTAYLIEEGEGTHDVLKRYHVRTKGTKIRPQLLKDYSALLSLKLKAAGEKTGFQIIPAELVEYETESVFHKGGREQMLRVPFVRGRSVHDIVTDKNLPEEVREKVAKRYHSALNDFHDFLARAYIGGFHVNADVPRANYFRDQELDGLQMITGRVSEKVPTHLIPEELKEFYSDPLNEEALMHKDGTSVISHPLIIKSDNVFVDLEDPELTMTLIDPF